jgi:mRNA interferase RelE/StbE
MREIVLTARALRDFKKIDQATRQRIAAKLRECAENPTVVARNLRDARIGTWRLRIGDYRAVFDIDGETLVVLRLGHRRDIYR